MLSESELGRLIDSREASFAVGVRGVIAEFHWTPDDEPVARGGALSVATSRGGIAVRLQGDERLARIPGNGPAAGSRVCWLPRERAMLATGRGLAALGADAGAIRPGDQDLDLFDLGFGLGHVRACVRTGDEALVTLLRAHRGEDLLAGGHPAMAAIKAASPHRVFMSARARIEVYQAIPSRSRGERTPPGPHTHVLPALMGDEAIPGLPPHACPVLTIHPSAV